LRECRRLTLNGPRRHELEMPRFCVIVNGVEVCREWAWERIAAVKEELKRLGFRWDGAGWRGRTRDLGVIVKLKHLINLSEKEYISLLSTLARETQGGAVVAIGQLPEGLRDCVLASEGGTHLVSLTRFLREFVARDRSIAQAETFEGLVEAGIGKLRELLRGVQVLGDLDAALESAREFVLSSERLRELFSRRRSWRTAAVGPVTARLNFLASGLLRRLAGLKMKYYVVRKDGSVEERDIRLARVERSGGTYVVRFPVFARDAVIGILRELGYAIRQEQVEYPVVQYRRSLSLHPFQAEAVERWAARGMRGTVVIPTGGGKTYIGMEAMYRAGTSALVLVVTRELALQWAERIKRHLGIAPGLLGGGSHEVRDVTVAIYNSAVRHVGELVGRFGLVIFDEAHHVPAETFKEVALKLDSPRRLALSATIKREDGNEHIVYEAVGPVVYRASYMSMVEAGLVVPVEHYRVYVRMTAEESAAYRSLPGDNPIALRNAAARSSSKVPVAARIVAREVELGSKVLVFTQFIEQAEEIYRRLREAGIAAELVTSESGNRDVALRRFSAGAVRCIVTTTVLDEGVDVPDADVAVIVSGTGSVRQMVQRVGRVVRASPGKRWARVYEIIARGTIEEALSRARHFDDVVEEVACRAVPDSELDALLGRIAARVRSSAASRL